MGRIYTKVKDGLPNNPIKVNCKFVNYPQYLSSNIYWFNPIDKTFRTKKGRNKTNRIESWSIL